ncbi:MAG TPA: hypothetical protein GX527_12135 [Clostridiaceae bacterium]|nr:hypothetical protein [Clostridiaceae bacterium]
MGALEVTIILVSVVFIIGGLVASNILSKKSETGKKSNDNKKNAKR